MKIPFGLRTHDQRMVDPTEVTKGQSCGCICPDPDCGKKLIAKQGVINEWHFAHEAGADCASGVESALHKMAKQLIMERSQIWVPERSFHREVLGSHDDVEGGYCWKQSLSIEVCAEGLKTLTNCIEEKQIETRRPDVLAELDGYPIAIEIAHTHFCDEAKLDWLKARNLTTLEIDVGMSPDIEMADIRLVLEARLFSSSPHKTWLVHSGDANGCAQIDAAENHLRTFNADKDAAFLKEVERKRAEKKRKDDFKERIKDIDFWTCKINQDLTLRIAYSRMRCTLKWHGYSKSAPEALKQATFELAKKYGGIFNKTYMIWEFKTPENQADELYRKMITFMENALNSPRSAQSPSFIPPIENQSGRTELQVEKPPPLDEVGLPTFQNEAEEETFKERAAILEYENNLSRADAEKIAIKEFLSSKM